MNEILALIRDYESVIAARNTERSAEGIPRLPKAKVRLLGQCSLIANEALSRELALTRTLDVDALLDGHVVLEQLFRSVVRSRGLIYDELSPEIWIPTGSTFTQLHDSELVQCDYLDSLFALLSKAIKAREKNRVLIADALAIFGETLVAPIRRYGGDVEFFLGGGDL